MFSEHFDDIFLSDRPQISVVYRLIKADKPLGMLVEHCVVYCLSLPYSQYTRLWGPGLGELGSDVFWGVENVYTRYFLGSRSLTNFVGVKKYEQFGGAYASPSDEDRCKYGAQGKIKRHKRSYLVHWLMMQSRALEEAI